MHSCCHGRGAVRGEGCALHKVHYCLVFVVSPWCTVPWCSAHSLAVVFVFVFVCLGQRRTEVYPLLAAVKITARVLNVQPLTPLRLLKSNCISEFLSMPGCGVCVGRGKGCAVPTCDLGGDLCATRVPRLPQISSCPSRETLFA